VKIPKDKLNEKGEYSLKDNEGLVGSPKESAPKDYQVTKKDEEEYKAFLDKVKKEIKKSKNKTK
jgi:regulator of RNase E activity RraA